MTVTELRQLLEKMEQSGLGNRQVKVPYTPPHTTMGARPAMNITAAHPGIDWDHGTVFLQPQERLGLHDEEVQKTVRSLESKLGKIHLLLSRNDRPSSPSIFGPEEVLNQVKELLAGPTKPRAPKP